MSSIVATNTVNNALIRIDQVCDYVPLASTITNLVDIFEKCGFCDCCSSESTNLNRYFSHVKDKSSLRCVILLVPILGNTIVGIYDLIQNHHAEGNEREDQDSQATLLGLEVSQLPQNISERHKIIENKGQENIQEATQKIIEALDVQIVGMHQAIEKFRKIIDNPEEPLEITNFFGQLGTYNGKHREKINYFWHHLKIMYAFQEIASSVLSLGGLDQNKKISQKQQEISELKNELLLLRQTSYHAQIQAIESEELLQEAQKKYLESFSKEEREVINESIEQITLETILPKLKERELAQAKDDYDIIEIREIISLVEHT